MNTRMNLYFKIVTVYRLKRYPDITQNYRSSKRQPHNAFEKCISLNHYFSKKNDSSQPCVPKFQTVLNSAFRPDGLQPDCKDRQKVGSLERICC